MIFKNTVVVAPESATIIEVVREMAESKAYVKGLAIVVDEFSTVKGVFNDGDLIRLLGQGKSMEMRITEVMTVDPILVNEDLSSRQIIDLVQQKLAERNINTNSLRDVIVVNEKGQLVNVLNFVDLLTSSRDAKKSIAVYGQGFVGITLAAALSNLGHKVYGVDLQESLISRLKNNDIHVFEPRLNDIVATSQKAGRLTFTTGLEDESVNYYIVAVGTPVDDIGNANLQALEAVASSIGKRLKRGDVVMLRSTVPVGTTRNVVCIILEKDSGMKAGVDFHLAFAPERTAEGKAMEELRSLPQIVGGLSPLCARKSVELWSSLTDSVVQVESLEAAELVKLINNSFRDLSFAFSNSVALLCDRYNINSFKLIGAANEGYPRNRIPLPSPGVGGYCLTKDPFLFAAVDRKSGHARLAVTGRGVNTEAQDYPLLQVERYIKRIGKSLKDTKILVVGLAFKGWPETNDLRGSSSVHVANALLEKGARVFGYDNVVAHKDWVTILPNVAEGELERDLVDSDVILMMNNHPKNVPVNFLSLISKGQPKLVFDGWALLDSNAINGLADVDYSTMGYLSNK
jgi:nucleotide sugar dehydrogenase